MVAPDGSYTRITGIFKREAGPLYRVTFEDGIFIDVDDVHNWYVINGKNGHIDGWRVKTTEWLSKSNSDWYIPVCDPAPGVKYEGRDPYVIGLMLGDGTTGSERVCIYNQDEFILNYMVEKHGWKRYKYEGQVERVVCPDSAISDKWKDAVGRHKGASKFIPTSIMKADAATRLACLQGLMDSDGSADKGGRVTFGNISYNLCRQVQYIARSLGGKATLRWKNRTSLKGGQPGYYSVHIVPCFKFIPFRLPRKIERLKNKIYGTKRRITSITRIGDGPSVCFAVDHPSHQYICQDFIVTHNTDIIAQSFFKNVGYGTKKGWGPHWRGMLFKRSIPETDTVFEKFKLLFEAACPEVKYVTHPYKVFRFPQGEMFTIRQMFDVEDYNALHGSEIPFLSFDELGNWPTPDVYLRCMSLMRSAHPEVSKHLRMWAATNPSGPGVGWIMKRFKLKDRKYDKTLIYDSAEDNPELARWKDDEMVNRQSRPRMSIFIDTRLNEIFMKANPTYLAEIAAQAPNDAIRRAWIDGEWGVASGGMFDDVYEDRYHVVKPFRIPMSWKIDRSMDWGSDSPFAILWFAQSDGTDYQDAQGNWQSSIQGDIFVIREWYGTTGQPNKGIKLTASAVARGIVEREMEWGIHDRCYPGPADNQIHTELNAGFNIEDCMKDDIRLRDGSVVPGIEWLSSDKASGARISGWSLIRERLKTVVPEEDRPFHREKPGLFFFRTCEHLLSHFPNTPRDEKKTEDVPTRGEYHLQDALRYRLLAEGRGLTSGPTVGKY